MLGLRRFMGIRIQCTEARILEVRAMSPKEVAKRYSDRLAFDDTVLAIEDPETLEAIIVTGTPEEWISLATRINNAARAARRKAH